MGYISLQQRLANDEMWFSCGINTPLAIKYIQVGEFGNDGVDATVVTGNTPATQAIYLRV
jgi:hypothetical protein